MAVKHQGARDERDGGEGKREREKCEKQSSPVLINTNSSKLLPSLSLVLPVATDVPCSRLKRNAWRREGRTRIR